jgi:hypothetical protein
MTKADWLRECPYHFVLVNMPDDAYDWLADNIHPNDWQGFNVTPRKIIGTPDPDREDLVVLRNSKEAMQFKLTWWIPNPKAA